MLYHEKPPRPSQNDTGNTPPGCTISPCPAQVTVAIKLASDVACPGHPLQINAIGNPPGGTYNWKVSGEGAQLVNDAGKPASTGAHVNLRSFQPDNAAGTIPSRRAIISVAYNHPNGKAADKKDVTIHAIGFDVSDMVITAGVTQAKQEAGAVQLESLSDSNPTIYTEPKVEIKIDQSCSRKNDCAKNHQIGFLQTLLTNKRIKRYTHTSSEDVVTTLPIRDQDQYGIMKPFYGEVKKFLKDGDKKPIEHQDTPRYGAEWTDTRLDAPAPPPAQNKQLRYVLFSDEFRVWLAVQNIEWAKHDKIGSFVFLRNFDWSVSLNMNVDTARPLGFRCTPDSSPPTIGSIGVGKGLGSPNLDDPLPGDPNQIKTLIRVAAPGG